MNRLIKLTRAALVLVALLAITGCTLGQTVAPTATAVDINAVMTSAAATAYVQLTQIAGQASPTSQPSQTPAPTNTLDPLVPTATLEPALQLLTPTSTDAAGGLPAVNTPVGGAVPSLTPAASQTPVRPAGTSSAATCLNSKFVGDVTIPDGTALKPNEKFRKVWRIQNTGTCTWDQGFGLTIWAGPAMHGEPIYFSTNDNSVAPGGVVDLGIDMRAPLQAGDYVAHWVMISDTGKTFGGDFTVVIKVVP